MPASAALAPVIELAVAPPEGVRLVVSGRGCPACGDSFCFNPAECLYFLTSRPYGDCDWCAGSGWAGEGSPSIFCDGCGGSGLDEYHPGSPTHLSERASACLAAHIDRLRARLGVAA